jgi:hypothetical protein
LGNPKEEGNNQNHIPVAVGNLDSAVEGVGKAPVHSSCLNSAQSDHCLEELSPLLFLHHDLFLLTSSLSTLPVGVGQKLKWAAWTEQRR